MSEVVGFASAAKTAVTECIISTNDETKCDDNGKVGLDTTATNISSTYVKSVTVGKDGSIAVLIQNTGEANLDTKNLLMKPSKTSAGVSWACGVAKADAAAYAFLPQQCRTEVSI